MLVSAIGKLNTFHRSCVKPKNTFGAECGAGKKNKANDNKPLTCKKLSARA